MSLIDAAKSHFSSKAIRSLHVPEWDVTLYSKNLTLDDRARMAARSDGNGTDYLVYAVIFGVTDEKGEPVFTLEDKYSLRKECDPEVVSRVANFVLESKTKSEEEREKN